jgi:hypothetical protein
MERSVATHCGRRGQATGNQTAHPSRGCRRQLNTDHRAARRFPPTVATLPEIIGGCVVVSSGEEGTGPASAVGQAAAVHGVAQPRVEHHGRGPRGRGFPDGREQRRAAWGNGPGAIPAPRPRPTQPRLGAATISARCASASDRSAALRQPRSHVTLLERRSDENRACATPLRRVVQCQVTAKNQTESSECFAAT